jgi:hypothetical protein
MPHPSNAFTSSVPQTSRIAASANSPPQEPERPPSTRAPVVPLVDADRRAQVSTDGM